AICNGRLSDERDVDAPIGRAQGTRHKVDPEQGKQAFTKLVPRAVGTIATLVEARPRTGRTHQIRVHAAHVGHPILGDRLYGGPVYTASTPPLAIGRVMLHAHSLVVPHPASGKSIEWIAAPPKDLVALATTLGLERGL
ncbi:MAG TPA: pseudouridine synthase, partial [Myxococcota bacterium]|nr:pseudouridine synthase [Myxococcota bacterium]